MTLRAITEHGKTALLLWFLVTLFAVVANACADVTSPIRPCEYAARPLSDSTSVVAYAVLPCYDANNGRVVRNR